ncbi:hypothetical protein ACWGQ5_47235 [Streptomyces sp. NPDC055722]
MNQVVWGEPEPPGGRAARVREQVLAAFDLPAELVKSWEAIAAAAAAPESSEEQTA